MSNTVINVTSTGQTFNMPGTLTTQQVVNMFGAEIPGLSGMSSEVTRNAAGDTVITFSARTGNKGALRLAA